ncbi:methyl-accepting chemotaxis protein [Roseateles amylovorans]|uniref:methyl-accepting chemotaxis protein n=1 Tax=Roseateles amylovorans TaxID=2978473 RepID=UPI0025B6D379|nr:methyl-accepting chemotaxis protein [Roseateles amylovorans]
MFQALNRMRITTLLQIGFAAVLVMAALMTGVGVYKLREMVRLSDELRVQEQRRLMATQWLGATELNLTRVMGMAKSGGNADLSSYVTPLMAQTTERINKLQEALETSIADSHQKTQLPVIAEARQRYVTIRKGVMDTIKQDPVAGAQQVDQTLAPAAMAYLATVRKLVEMISEDADAFAAEQRAQASQAAVTMMTLTGLAIALGALIAWRITRSVRAPMVQAGQVAQTIASGDLSQDINIERSDEIGVLLRQLSLMQDGLRRMVSQVREGTETINMATQEIATGNHDLSARTEATASNLQQTASSMEELTGTVAHTATSAQQANELVSATRESASKGGVVVSEVVAVMEQIESSSKRINDIIGVIDGIAFQTNILALNAAVEAARAGEQGRGFAVVAGEVRALAQRSASAAREIKTLIGENVSRVESGTRLVRNAGDTMGEIVLGVRRVADIVGEIATAASEQNDGIGQVNVAVQRLDEMTQQNAALVEESAAAAGSLRTQAENLNQLVSTFRLA